MVITLEGQFKKTKHKLRPGQIVFMGFTMVIFAGTVLLMLPIATKEAGSADFMTAFFTATSATCVTGLVVVDTYQYWTDFGQFVILSLIQIGGLGFMTFATMFSLIVRRRITISERLVMMESLNFNDMSGVVRTTRRIIFGTLAFEAAGAFILSIRFIKDFGILGGIKKGVFHSVSAFCNAGFDLMGESGTAFSSLMGYQDDLVVNIVIMILIIMGGLGFLVWDDIANLKVPSFKKLTPYSKLVIIVTGLLILIGTITTFSFEFSNSATIGDLPLHEKILTSLFQSVTTRTAGFNTIDQAALRPETQIVSMILMFIGGSSGSTAGGIKTVTFAVLVLMAVSVAKGSRRVTLYERAISTDYVFRALTIFFIAVTMVFTGTILLLVTHDIDPLAAMFECVSAFATVGLSMGATPSLSLLGKIYIIMLMFFGRLGILTVTLSIARRLAIETGPVKYPMTKIMIG